MSMSAQELYELNQAGRSYGILASQNGMTRGVVAGKISRWKNKNNSNSNSQTYGERAPNPVKRTAAKTTVVPLNIELEDLKNRQCRYPYGEGPYTFCGHPVKEGSPYCAEHHKICLKSISPKQVKNSTDLGSWG